MEKTGHTKESDFLLYINKKDDKDDNIRNFNFYYNLNLKKNN